jgi:hypothetical protein
MSSLFSFVSVSMKELPRYCLISKEISYSTWMGHSEAQLFRPLQSYHRSL